MKQLTRTQKFLQEQRMKLIPYGLKMADIVRESGVTAATISRGENGQSSLLDETRDKIEAAVRKCIQKAK